MRLDPRQITTSWQLLSLLTLCWFSVSQVVDAGVAYSDPEGGWTYKFDGDAAAGDDFEALDGSWEHDNGSDSWDGSQIGEDAPGGVSALIEDGTGTTFIRIQDTGDPRDYFDETGVDGDPSNRKIFLDRDIIEIDDISEEYLDEGFTFSVRTRLATAATGPVDPWYPDGGGGADDWPEGGIGYVIDFDSTANFSFYMPDGLGSLGFALAKDREDQGVEGQGLLMNSQNGDFECQDCGDTDMGEINLFEVEDMTEWHEFWVTIQGLEEGGDGTHLVSVYADGSLEPAEFQVTAGVRADGGNPLTQGPLSMGMPGTAYESAMDVDFIAYIPGVVPPGPGTALGDYNMNGELDAGDLDLQSQGIKDQDLSFDLTGDGVVDFADREAWVRDLKNTWIGDSTLDGEFNSGDLVAVFTAGKFEQDVMTGWAEGDWDGDMRFGSGDLVAAFTEGGFEMGPRPAPAAVPEPSSVILVLLGLAALVVRRR